MLTSFSGTDYGDYANGVAIDSRAQIVAVGTTSTGTSDDLDFALARYRTNGSLDPSFGGDGKVTTRFPPTAWGSSVSIDSSDRILAAGATAHDSGDFALARYVGYP